MTEVEESRGTRIGRNLRRLREDALLSRAQLAQLSGVSEAAISKIEFSKTERPYRRTVKALSDALGVDLNDIAGESTPPLAFTEGLAAPLGEAPAAAKSFARVLREMQEAYSLDKPLAWSREDLERIAAAVESASPGNFGAALDAGLDDLALEIAMLSGAVSGRLRVRAKSASEQTTERGRQDAERVVRRLEAAA